MDVFTVYVADNFHYMDAEATYKRGEFATWDEAVTEAERIVEASLRELYRPDLDDGALYHQYTLFGEDPYIVPQPAGKRFSAWEYAQRRCQTLSSA